MTAAILGAAARYATPMLMDVGKQYLGAKMAEGIGNSNVNASATDRLKASLMNEDPDKQGQRGAAVTEQGKNAQFARDRNAQIFSNQLDATNKRADLQNQMTAADQIIAANRGTQLANNYLDASNAQGTASANIMNSIMNRQATSYGVSGLR